MSATSFGICTIALVCMAACGSTGGGDAPIDATIPWEASTDAATDARSDTLAPHDDANVHVASDASGYAPYYTYTLASQAFPDSGHPGVLVHVPPGFDPDASFGVVVYFHGFDNCVVNVVGSTDTPCLPDPTPRVSYNLIAQFDAARVQALLVLPEVQYDMADGDPGQLGDANGLRDLLTELFTVSLVPVVGSHSVNDLGRVVVMTHSGGYVAAALSATMGGVAQVREIDLLDSLYGEFTVFDGWVMEHVADPSGVTDALGTWRFADVYSDSGGTEANSRSMAMEAAGWVMDPSVLLFDDTYDTLTAAQYAHPLIFKRSELSHDGIPAYYFGELVRASGFALLP